MLISSRKENIIAREEIGVKYLIKLELEVSPEVKFSAFSSALQTRSPDEIQIGEKFKGQKFWAHCFSKGTKCLALGDG